MRSSNILPLNSPNSTRGSSGPRGYSSPMRVARMDTSPRNDIAPRPPPQAGGSSSDYATPRRYDPSSGSGSGGGGSILPVLTSPAMHVQVPPLRMPSPNAFKRTVWTTPKSPHELPTGNPSSSSSTTTNNCGLQTSALHNSRSYEDDQQYAYELDEGGDGGYPSYYPGDGDNATYMFNPTSDQVSDSPSSSSSSLLSRLRCGGSEGIDPDKQKHSDGAAQLEQVEYMEQIYNTVQVLNAELEKERQDRHVRLAAAGSSIDDEVSAALEYPSMYGGGGHHHHHQYPANASDFFDDPSTSLLAESTPSTSSGSRRSRPLPSQPKRPVPAPSSSQNSRILSKNQVELCATLGKNAELRIRTKEMEKSAEKASVQLNQAQKQMKMVERRISNREEKLRILMKEKLHWQKELKDMRDQVVEEKMRQVELFRRLETAKRENAAQMEQLEHDLREIHDENQSLRAQVAEERAHITFQAKKLDEVMRQAREEKEKLVSCIAETKYKFKEWKEGEAAALRNSREQAVNNVKTEYDLKITRHQEEKQKLREKVKDLEVSLRLMQKDRTLSPLELSLRKATILGSKDAAGISETELIEAHSRIHELEALMEHSQEYQKRQESIIKVSEATISRLVQEREVTALEYLSAQPLTGGLTSPMFATDPNNAFASSMPSYSVSSSSPNIGAQRDASKRQSYGSVKSPPSHGNPSLSSLYGKPRASSSTTSRIQPASSSPSLSAQYRNDHILAAQPSPPQVSSTSTSSFSLMTSSPSKLSKTSAVEPTQDEKEKIPEPRGHSHRRQDTGIHGIHAVGAKNGLPKLVPYDSIDEDVDVEEESELPDEAKDESQDVQMESRDPSTTTSAPSLVVSPKEQFLANEVARLQKELADLKTSTSNQDKREGSTVSTLGEPHSIAGGAALDGDEQAEDNVAAADPEVTVFDESALCQYGISEETEEELESDNGRDSVEEITQEQNESPPRELEDAQGKDQLQQLDQTASVQDSISENEDEVKGDDNEARPSEISFDETESKDAGADRSEVKNPDVAVHEASADEETFSELRAPRVVDATEKTALLDVSADDEVSPISVPGEASAVGVVSPMEDKFPAQEDSINASVSQNEVESSLDSTATSESVNREVEESSAEEQLYEPDASKKLVAVTDADFPNMIPNGVDTTLEVDDSIVKETSISEISSGSASLSIMAPEECNLEAKEETYPVILVGESTRDEEMRQELEESKRDETPDAKNSIVNDGGADESGAARESRDAKNPNDGAEENEESAQVEAKSIREECSDQSEVQEENSAKDEDGRSGDDEDKPQPIDSDAAPDAESVIDDADLLIVGFDYMEPSVEKGDSNAIIDAHGQQPGVAGDPPALESVDESLLHTTVPNEIEDEGKAAGPVNDEDNMHAVELSADIVEVVAKPEHIPDVAILAQLDHSQDENGVAVEPKGSTEDADVLCSVNTAAELVSDVSQETVTEGGESALAVSASSTVTDCTKDGDGVKADEQSVDAAEPEQITDTVVVAEPGNTSEGSEFVSAPEPESSSADEPAAISTADSVTEQLSSLNQEAATGVSDESLVVADASETSESTVGTDSVPETESDDMWGSTPDHGSNGEGVGVILLKSSESEESSKSIDADESIETLCLPAESSADATATLFFNDGEQFHCDSEEQQQQSDPVDPPPCEKLSVEGLVASNMVAKVVHKGLHHLIVLYLENRKYVAKTFVLSIFQGTILSIMEQRGFLNISDNLDGPEEPSPSEALENKGFVQGVDADAGSVTAQLIEDEVNEPSLIEQEDLSAVNQPPGVDDSPGEGLADSGTDQEDLDSRAPNFVPPLNDQDTPTENPSSSERGKGDSETQLVSPDNEGDQVSRHRALEQEPAFPQDLLDSTANNGTASSDPQDTCIRVRGEENVEGEGASVSTCSSDQVLQEAVDAEALLLDSAGLEANTDLDRDEPAAIDQESQRLTTPDSSETKIFAEKFVLNVQSEAVALVLADQCPHRGDLEDGAIDFDESDVSTAVEPERISVESVAESALQAAVGDGDTVALLVPEQDDQCCEEADDCEGSCADTEETPQAEVTVRPFAASTDEPGTLTTSSSMAPQESLAESEFSAVDFVAAVKAEAIAFVTKSVLMEEQMSVDANAKGADIPGSGDDEGSVNCDSEPAYKEEDGVLAIEAHCDSAASENPELSQINTVSVKAAATVSVSGLVFSDSAAAAAQPTSADSDLSESEVSEPCGKSVEPAHVVEKVPEDVIASVKSLYFATEVDVKLARELDRILNTLDAEDSRIASGADVGIDAGNCVVGPTEPSVDSIEKADADCKITEIPLIADDEDVLAELVEVCKGEDGKKSDADVVAVEATPSVAGQAACLVADVAEVSLKLSLEITASALEAYSAAWTTNGVDTGVVNGGIDTLSQEVPVVCENDTSHNDAENAEDTECSVPTNVEAECAHEKVKATNRPANDDGVTLQGPVLSDFQTEGTEGPSKEEAGADTTMQQEHNADDSRYNSVVRPNSPHEEVCTDENAIQHALEGVVGRLSIIQASRANLLDEVFREVALTTTPDQVNTVEVCQTRESETSTIDDPEWCDQLLSEPPEISAGVSDANTESDTTTAPAPNSGASSAIEDPDALALSPATTITDDTLAQGSDAVTSSAEVEIEDSNSVLSGNPHSPDGQATEDKSVSASLPQLSTNPDCGDPPPRASSEAATIPASQVDISSAEHVIDESLIETVDIEISVSVFADGKDSETEPVTVPINETQDDQVDGSLNGGASTNELDVNTQSEADGTAAEQCPGSDVCETKPIPAKQELTATDPPEKMVESIVSLSTGVIEPASASALEGPANKPKNEAVADPISEAETRKTIESDPAMDEASNAPVDTTEHYTDASNVDTAVAAATTVTEMQDVETSAADGRPDVFAALNGILDEIEWGSIAVPAIERESLPERTVSNVTWDLPPESEREKTTASPAPKSRRTEQRRTSRRLHEQSRYASSSEMMRDPTLAAYDAHREQGQPFALLDDNIFSIDPDARHMQHDENDNAKCTDLEIRAKRKNFDQDNHRKSIAYRSIPAFNYAPVLICFQWSDFVVATPISVCNLTDPVDKKSWNPASPVKKMRLLAKKGIKLPCGSYVIISAFIRPLEDGNENLRIHIYDSEWVEEFQYDFFEDHLKEYIHEWTGRDEEARLFMTQLEFRREEGGIIIKLPDKIGQEEVKRPIAAPTVAMSLPDGKEHLHHDHSSPQPPRRNSRHSHRPSTSPHVPFLPIQARSLSNLSDSSKREKRHDTDDSNTTNDSALSKD